MKRVIFISLSSLLIFFVGCNVLDSNNKPDNVHLRVVNKSSIDFSSVLVSYPEATIIFNKVPAGQASKYKDFDIAYRSPFVKAKADTNTYIIRGPIDYLGDEPLKNGYYSYELTLVEGHLKGDIVSN